MTSKEVEVRNLQERVRELERQLVDERATVLALTENQKQVRGENRFEPLNPQHARLLANEERFSGENIDRIFQANPVAMTITREEDGRYLDVNQAFCELVECDRSEIIGRTSVDLQFFTEVERKMVTGRLQSGGTVRQHEFTIATKTGAQRRVLISLQQIEVGGEAAILATILDITGRKRAEEALRESEERYRGLFEKMQEGLVAAEVITDEVGKPIDYRYLDVNPATERQFGIPREQFVGRTYTEVLPQGDKEWIEIFGKVGLTGEPLTVERYGRASGRWFECHLYSPRRGQVVNIVTDVTERKRVEDALRKSEERFAKAFHASPDAIIISRISDGLILEVNEGWTAMFGHEPQEVIGKTSLELNLFARPDDRKEAVRRLREEGAVRDFELEVRRKSGELRLVNLSAERIEINGEGCLLTVLRDITEAKQAEEALRKSEERFAKAFHRAPFGMHITRWRDGAFLDVNDTWLKMFGWSRNEVLGKSTAELNCYVRPEDRHRIRDLILEGHSLGDMELHVRRKDGGEFFITAATTLIDLQGERCILSVVNDVTEQKRTEQALRESEERFRSLADSMPQLVWTALPDGTVDYYNQRYQEYREIKHAESAAWEWAPVLHPDDRQFTMDAWQRAVATGEMYQAEHRVRTVDGSYRWHLSRGVPMRDGSGRIIRWFGTATDIHDLKVAEEKLQDYAHRLERSNQELQEFAFIASHDLQEPLRKIQFFGDLILERASSLDSRGRDYVERMRKAAERMRDMVDGLLELSRINTQGRPFVRVDLSQVTAEVLSTLEAQIRRAGGVVQVDKMPDVEGDPMQLHQLMQNLISNALKYHEPDVHPRVKVHAKELAGEAQIFVVDQGIGFEQENAEKIFQPFQRLVGRGQYDGSGMGLAICRRIVERHNGEITARSKPGQGATFIVTLPLRQPDTSNDRTSKALGHAE